VAADEGTERADAKASVVLDTTACMDFLGWIDR
jgi:hypothetical protein